jgi:hypothetical protein
MEGTACRVLSSAFPLPRGERMRQNTIELNNFLGSRPMTKRDKRWVPSDDERLLKFRDAGLALAVIATALGRTRTDVEKRLGTFKKQIVNSNQPDVSEAG